MNTFPYEIIIIIIQYNDTGLMTKPFVCRRSKKKPYSKKVIIFSNSEESFFNDISENLNCTFHELF